MRAIPPISKSPPSLRFHRREFQNRTILVIENELDTVVTVRADTVEK